MTVTVLGRAPSVVAFIGGGAHWRVLPIAAGAWQVFRRHWDTWEPIGAPHLSHVAAMTEAHRLARLNRGG